jgi:hypothetical protein
LLNPDGTPVPADRLGLGDDRAGETERVMARLARGEIVEAWRAAGVDLDPTEPEDKNPWTTKSSMDMLVANATWPVGLADEVRRLTTRHALEEVYLHAGWPARVRLRVIEGHRVVATLVDSRRHEDGRPELDERTWLHPVDLHLLWRGMLDPDELHPLVHASLFPHRPAPPSPVPSAPTPPAPVRVRCRGQWHRVRVVAGRIRPLDHDSDEEQREQTLRALGGTSSGCFAALHAWHGGDERLPKRLRGQQREMLDRIVHGDTAYVLAMLDAGYLDPRMRARQGWSLMHLLLYLEPEPLLGRLLAAGLPIDGRDIHGRTPLHVVVGNDGSAALARALYEAGADPTAADEYEGGIQELLQLREKEKFSFLAQEEDR